MIGLGLGLGFSQPVAASGGGGLGPELIVNGDMSSSVGWALDPVDGTLEIAGGVMSFASGEESPIASQAPSLTEGLTYRLAGTVASLGGTVATMQVYVGGNQGTDVTANGPFSQDTVAGPDDSVIFTFQGDFPTPGTSGTLDDASLKQVL